MTSAAPPTEATPLRLRGVDAVAVSVPLEQPVRTASGHVTHAPLLLIDLHTDAGITGRSYLFAYTPLALGALAQLVRALGAALQGRVMTPAALQRELAARFRLLGHTGLVTMAAAGLDIAAWDAQAQAAGQPLWQLLGGDGAPVPAYSSQGMDGWQRGVELAESARAQGFGLMKIKIGYPNLDEDLRVIAAVRDALGDSVQLAVDFNQSLQRSEAMRRGQALEAYDLAWIEEPLSHDDDAGHAQLAAAWRTPLQLGENWFGTAPMARSLAVGACDLVMPDLMKIGGVSGWLHAAALAQAARLPMSSHLFPEVTAHLMGVTPTAHWLEWLDLAAPVLAQPARIEAGHLTPSRTPGLGLAWNPDAVARYVMA